GLEADADRHRPRLVGVEVDAGAAAHVGVGRRALHALATPPAAPVAEGVLLLGGGAEVDVEAAVIEVREVDPVDQRLVNLEARVGVLALAACGRRGALLALGALRAAFVIAAS